MTLPKPTAAQRREDRLIRILFGVVYILCSLLTLIGVLLLCGCSAPNYSHGAFHLGEVQRVEIHARKPRTEALADAQRVWALQRNAFVTQTLGTGSMSRNWTGETWAVTIRTTAKEIRLGDIIIFRNRDGALIIHAVVARDGGGLITAGTANKVADYGRVTDANLLGRVVSVHPFTP